MSHLRHLKRPDLALDFAEQLSDATIHMVGGKMLRFSELYQQVKARSKHLGNVVFHGRLSYPETLVLYDRTKTFINTSEQEGFANSYIQAWCRAVPLVVRCVTDGIIQREGLGIAVKSIEDMIEGVRFYLNSPGELAEARMRCLAYVHRMHDEKKVLAPYLETVARMLS